MKKSFKLITLAFVAAILFLSHGTAKAADNELIIVKAGLKSFDKNLEYISTCNTSYAFMNIEGVTDVTITSSNESICSLTLNESDTSRDVDFRYKAPGKVTITSTYKYKGKDYKTSCRIKVVPYSNPFKSLKIGSKNYKKILDTKKAEYFGTNAYGYAKVTGKKKVSWKLKNGYKMYQTPSIQTKNNKSMYFSKNKKLQLAKIDYLHFFIKDKEGYKTMVAWQNKKPDNY